jgi:hypothetical protein
MHKRYVVALYRFFFCALVLLAVGVELDQAIRMNTGIVNFFSFFTYESNIFAAILFLLGGVAAIRGAAASKFAAWRGAATVYMAITGAVYTLLLRSDPVTIPWANDVLHYIFPVVVIADWFIIIPNIPITYKKGLLWTIYPFIYLVYTLLRGAVTHWYPYTFIDPRTHGYAGVARTSIAILIAALILIALLTYTTKSAHQNTPGVAHQPSS